MQEMKSVHEINIGNFKHWARIIFFCFLMALTGSIVFVSPVFSSPEPSFDQETYQSSAHNDSAYQTSIPTSRVSNTSPTSIDKSITEEEPTGLFDKLVFRFQHARAKTRILVVFLLYFLLSFITLFTFILINRTIKSNRRKKAEKLTNIYQEQLADYLFGDENEVPVFQGLNNSFDRNVLLHEILGLHSNISGESAEKLRDLYFNLGFHKDSLSKAYNRKWYIKVKGFRELAQMNFKEANEHIYKFVTSKNNILRIESQIALVKLSEDNPLFFLEKMKEDLSEWEQINILETINYHKIDIPSFERYLESNNLSVISFAIKMIGVFKHTFSIDKVIKKLAHISEGIRRDAIKTISQLEMPEGIEALKQAFDAETERNQELIMDTMVMMSGSDDVPFLKHVLNTNTNFRVCVNAARILQSLPNGKDALEGINALADDYLKTIISNVKESNE